MAKKRRRRKSKKSGDPIGAMLAIALVLAVVVVAGCAIYLSQWMKKDPVINSSSDQGESSQISSVEQISSEDGSSSSEEASSEVSSSDAPDYQGTWKRTGVVESKKATLEISSQDDFGFDFSISASASDGSGKVSGHAYFSDDDTASYKSGSAKISFKLQGSELLVTHSGKLSQLGCSGSADYDGTYTTGRVSYIDEKIENELDFNLYKESRIKDALKKCMSADDYEILSVTLTDSNIRVYQSDEYTYDKNGKGINVDKQINAIKYYADYAPAGYHALLIATDDAKVYVAVVDFDGMRYYTNDSKYKSQAPSTFKTAADNYGVSISYMS